jgi:hypothetical protein
MDTLQELEKRAIRAANMLNWSDALLVNQSILEIDTSNTSALNRMARAYTQMKDMVLAKKTYLKVLEIDPYNTIAKKNLLNLKHANPTCVGSIQSGNSYIEEPGKTKIIQLCRVAEPSILTSLAVGTPCFLKLKTHRVGVETEQQGYIGSLPDDLSHHLSELIKGGAEYMVTVQSVNKTECKVFIRECMKPRSLSHLTSFPSVNQSKEKHAEAEEELLVDQSYAFEMPETDEEPDQHHREYDDTESPDEN